MFFEMILCSEQIYDLIAFKKKKNDLAIFRVTYETLRCLLRIRRDNLTDSIAVVVDGGGDGGFGTESDFKKESANCALIEGVNCASLLRA